MLALPRGVATFPAIELRARGTGLYWSNNGLVRVRIWSGVMVMVRIKVRFRVQKYLVFDP